MEVQQENLTKRITKLMKKRWERYLKNHLRFSETLLSKSKRQILICTVFETIFQFMWQFLELFKKTYEIWDKGNSPSSMLRGRSPLLSSGIKYFVENIRWLQNNLFLANFLPSQRLSILLQWFFSLYLLSLCKFGFNIWNLDHLDHYVLCLCQSPFYR